MAPHTVPPTLKLMGLGRGRTKGWGTVRKWLGEEHQFLFDRYYAIAIKGGCDEHQARAIANERTLLAIMKYSAKLSEMRERMASNTGRDKPL